MSSKRIYFLATDDNVPSGGRRVIYSLIDILCKQGYEAYALHQTKGFSYTWFHNETPTTWTHEIRKARHKKRGIASYLKLQCTLIFESIRYRKYGQQFKKITSSDLLIIPENRVANISNIFPGIPKIVLNQNSFFFLRQPGLLNPENNIHHPDLIAWITVSKLIHDTLTFSKVTQPIYRVPNYINKDLFNFRAAKKKQIAYMPRRLKEDATALLNLLRLRNNLRGFDFKAIDKAKPSEVAEILKDSAIFLSFSHREGFGLPPAEAIACGCTVIGYTGNAGIEFMDESICFPIEDGDLLKFVITVENAIKQQDQTPNEILEKRRNASKLILQSYSLEKTSDAIIKALNNLMEIRKPLDAIKHEK